MNRWPIFVAEVKPQSPFGFKSELQLGQLFHLAHQHGDMLSIHTDERWGGSWDWLSAACKESKKPILAKGIHPADDDIERALDCGADRVLVVGRIPADKYLDKIWYEPVSLQALWDAPGDLKLVWNRRDLATGEPKSMYARGQIYNDEQVFTNALAMQTWICQASYIKHPWNVELGVRAFIVGEHLPEFVKELW